MHKVMTSTLVKVMIICAKKTYIIRYITTVLRNGAAVVTDLNDF